MATYYAVKSGNINATDVWATAVGGSASDVYSTFTSSDVLVTNGFTITVNVSTTVGTVTNDGRGSSTASGSFSLSNGVTLTANIVAGTAQCATISGTASATIVGSITGGSASSAYGLLMSSTGTLTVTGNVTAGTGVNSQGITFNANGILNVTGNVTGGAASSATGVYSGTSGSVTITGTVTGGSGSYGAEHTSSQNMTIVGTAIGAAASGARCSGGGVMTVTRAKGGPLVASAAGVSAASASVAAVEEIEYGDLGASPTAGPIRLTDKTSSVAVMYRFGTTKKNLVDANASGNMPAASNVRSGTVYNGGNSTGTCAVPAASSVAFGVPVDATTGTAALTPAAVWDYLTSSANTAGSMGERLKNAATVASVGQALSDALTP